MKNIKISALAVVLIALCGIVYLRVNAEEDVGECAETTCDFTDTYIESLKASNVYHLYALGEFPELPIASDDVAKPIMMITESADEPDAQEVEDEQKYYEDIPLSSELQLVLFEACERNGIDPAIALALIETESRFQPDAVNSYSGCYGLCQLNPACFPSGLCYAENINYGIDYLGRQVRVYGGYPAGLTAYAVGHDDGSRGYANTVISASDKWRSVLEA